MSGIIEGYNYDIFISYRQKDNKGDRWVSEFVETLKTELDSTFKEEVSVYFDINPRDGLLETHDVDASLKEKLKCLVFIPIISRTYCDPKSFAWEHEFKAFVEQASRDQFGLKVMLPDGNVTNRVLPVRIYDLDIDDIKSCESVLGGALRGVDFIYRSPGINRPLRSKEENPHDNLNHIIYRDQINKVANAIKGIFSGLKTQPDTAEMEMQPHAEPREGAKTEKIIEQQQIPLKFTRLKLFSGIFITIILIFAAVLSYLKIIKSGIFDRTKSPDGRISIVVMPFQNLTNDTIWDVWQRGIQNEMITSLTNSEELKVRQVQTINSILQSKGLTNYASIVPSVAAPISQKLDAGVFIHGSIKQAGPTIRLDAQLINSKTEEIFKSFHTDGTKENILQIIDSLTGMVKSSLIISKLFKELPSYQQHQSSTTASPEAYRYYLYGENAQSKRDYATAKNMFLQSLAIDSNYIYMNLMLSYVCMNQGLFDEARIWGDRAYEKSSQMPIWMKILTDRNHAIFHESPLEEIKYLRQYLEIDDQFPGTYYNIGLCYKDMFQYDKAIPEFEKALEIYDKLDLKPWWIFEYSLLAHAYQMTGQYKKEKRLFREADRDFPDDPAIIWLKAILSLTEEDTIAANKYIEQYKSFRRDKSWTEAGIAYSVARIYVEAGNLEKAEEYHRLELSFEPDDPFRMWDLASFLIEKDRNINEGMELVNKALKLKPDEHWFLDSKGWGLYKQGKYDESLKVLEKSRDLSPLYRHQVYVHIEEVKKAIALQKTN